MYPLFPTGKHFYTFARKKRKKINICKELTFILFTFVMRFFFNIAHLLVMALKPGSRITLKYSPYLLKNFC